MRNQYFTRSIITFFLVLLVIILAIFLGAYSMGLTGDLSYLSRRINDHRLLFTFIRLMIYAGFFMVWPTLIHYRAKKYHWPVENIPRAMCWRYPLLLFFLFLEALGQFGPVGGP